MSVFINCGYYAVSKQILNIILKPTILWHNGIILTNENKLKLVNYKDTSVLLLNNSIIYENKNLFNYNVDLSLKYDVVGFNEDRFKTCIKYEYIKCI